MNRLRVTFLSGKLRLEGRLEMPDGPGPFPAVVICHPHPLYGGNMNNNVGYAVGQALAQSSIAALRFNFRGVGSSEGQYANGIGEQEDVKAAVSYLASVKEVDKTRIGIAGYSFGAVVGMPVGVKDERVKALAAISPPFSLSDFRFLLNCHKPRYLILGNMDEYTPESDFLEFCGKLNEPRQCETVKGPDHFWAGYETEVAGKIAGFFSKELKQET